ncbi:hypothetical protein E4U56_002039 [Claviceps arundinis]|uniref:Uncharacterized protein n=1 Tax=Claviceps arundinis TaxID=1623583 RepID=A0A9P7SPS5_9HYPO|nr:hypothetical protein E4U56_002039 [Claviceps arundinis]
MPPTSNPNILTRDLPHGITYDLRPPNHILVSLPPSSTWSSGLHWHEAHTEYLKVLQGSIRLRIGSRRRIVSASATHHPEIRIDKFVPHEWARADPGGSHPVVVLERWDPPDGEETLLCRNVNGVRLEGMRQRGRMRKERWGLLARLLLRVWIELRVMVMCARLDCIPVYVDLGSWPRLRGVHVLSGQRLAMVDWVLSHVILTVAALMGWVMGMEAVDGRWTPRGEMEEWVGGGGEVGVG